MIPWHWDFFSLNPSVPHSPLATGLIFSASWPRPSDLAWLHFGTWLSYGLSGFSLFLSPPHSAHLSLVAIYDWRHPWSCGSCDNWLPSSSPGFLWFCTVWDMDRHLCRPCIFRQGHGRQELWELGTRHCPCQTEQFSAPKGIGVGWDVLSGIRKVNIGNILHSIYSSLIRGNVEIFLFCVVRPLMWKEDFPTREAHFCSY